MGGLEFASDPSLDVASWLSRSSMGSWRGVLLWGVGTALLHSLIYIFRYSNCHSHLYPVWCLWYRLPFREVDDSRKKNLILGIDGTNLYMQVKLLGKPQCNPKHIYPEVPFYTTVLTQRCFFRTAA